MSTLNVNNIDKESGSNVNIGGSGTTVNIGASGQTTNVTGTLDASNADFVPKNPLSNRNLVMNGAMNVAQRATQVTGVTSSGYRTCDRWHINFNTSGTWTIDQSTDAPEGFANSLKSTCTTAAPASPSYAQLRHIIEGKNLQHLKYVTANAKPVTLSFWVKSNKTGTASLDMIRSRTGTVRHITKGYEIPSANTWHYITVEFLGDTSGDLIANDNSGQFEVSFWLNSGSTYTGGSFNNSWSNYVPANANPSNLGVGGAVNDYFAITGVQLEVGNVATPFEHESYGQTLAKCQRYYFYESGTIYGYRYGASEGFAGCLGFPVTMRASPTLSYTTVRTTSGLTAYVTPNSATYLMTSTEPYVSGLTADAEL